MTAVEPPAPDSEPTVADQRSIEGAGSSVATRSLVALVAAVTCVAFAVLTIVGPADHSSTKVSWPGNDHQMLGPSPVGTPFILTQREPRSIRITVPCAATTGPSLASGADKVVLATAREPRLISGLVVLSRGNEITVTVGDRLLSRVEVPSRPSDRCRFSLAWDEGGWVVEINGRPAGHGIEVPPILSGLFTDFPPSTSGDLAPTVTFETIPQDSSTSGRQFGFIVLAVLFGLGSLWSVAPVRALRFPGITRRFGISGLRLSDVVVVAVLAIWWVVSSPLSDDGWVASTVLNRANSGSFSNYYDLFNAQLTMGFLHDSILWLMASVSESLLWLRVPALLSALVCWYLCRRVLALTVEDPGGASARVIRATLASVFLVGWMAAGMTLRPEFLTGLLAVGVALAMEHFRRDPVVARLIVPSLLIAVAVSVHPVGVVAVAPVVGALPLIWGMVRSDDPGRLFAVVSVGLVASAVVLLLMFADSDTGLWTYALELQSLSRSHSGGAIGEYTRYKLMFTTQWGIPMMRAAFLIPMTVCVGALLWAAIDRRRRVEGPILRFAAYYLLALALLSFVPSKWPVHIAALAGFGALASAAAVAGLLGRSAVTDIGRWRSATGLAGSLLAATAVVYFGASSFSGYEGWMVLGVVDPGLRSVGPAWITTVASLFVVIGGAVHLVGSRRSAADARGSWAMRFSATVPVLVATAFVVALLGVYIVDNVGGRDGFAIGRLNLGTTVGDCGFADALEVGDPFRARPLPPAAEVDAPTPIAPIAMVEARAEADLPAWWEPHDAGSESGGPGSFSTPWQKLGRGARGSIFEFWTSGRYAGGPNLAFEIEHGTAANGRVGAVGSLSVQPEVRYATTALDRWRPTYLSLNEVPPGADRVRLVVTRRSPDPSSWVGISSIAMLPMKSLSSMIGAPGVATYLDPAVRLLAPCAKMPSISNGVVAAPSYGITQVGPNDFEGGVRFGKSTFWMMSDVYEFPPLRLAVRDRERGPRDARLEPFLVVDQFELGRLRPFSNAR